MTVTKHLFAVLLVLTSSYAVAQLELPAELVLSSPNVDNRQVIGLADPVSPTDAVSLDAARTNVYARTTVSGSASLLGQLTPAPTSYSIGLSVIIVPNENNAQAATLELNGLGPRFIVKTGDVPLSTGDLRAGVPAHLIFDGQHFQLISATHFLCPGGYTGVHQNYCIADQPQAAATFFQANTTCIAQGARLCSIAEWSHACLLIPAFFGTVSEAEWVDHAANNTNGAKLVGVGIDGGEAVGAGCNFGGQNQPTVPFRFRCCVDR